MSQDRLQNDDLRATLALSQNEAYTGTNRVLNLPDGRQTTVTVPPGAYNGQEIRLDGQGQMDPYTGQKGALILTVAIAYGEQFGTNPYASPEMEFPTEMIQPPPPPGYPSAAQPGMFTNYSSQPGANSTYPNTASGANAQLPQYTAPSAQQTPTPPRRKISRGMTILLIALALLIIAGSGLVLYAAIIQPQQAHMQATAVAQTGVAGTAHAQATATQVVVDATNTANAQATANASATATALQSIYTTATSGTLALNDSLKNQSGANWELDTKTGGGGCAFTGGAYHSTMPQTGFFASCMAQATNFSNFALQVQMTILHGDRGGVIFRADNTNAKFYLFRIGQDGSYNLFKYVDNNGGNAIDLHSDSTTAMHTGLNQMNLLTVIARGSNIYIYINKQYVTSVSDSTYTSGQVGVFGEDHTNATDVAFSNIQVWKL